MSAKYFKCPDGQEIEIVSCLASGGCRMGRRCATLPYLRVVSHERDYRGVTPSAAGNGPRLIYLRQVADYTIDPDARAYAALGTATHSKLSLWQYTRNVLSEETLTADEIMGIPDVLEHDEEEETKYVLSDYKTWGSFKVAKALGLQAEDVAMLDDSGNIILYKTGEKKGTPRMRKVYKRTGEPDLLAEELQINRYRILFEQYGFSISRMQVQAIVRDGATYIAEGRGIDRRIYVVPIQRLSDDDVFRFYKTLSEEVEAAFATGKVRKCNSWESWEGRRCQECEVLKPCQKMDNQN